MTKKKSKKDLLNQNPESGKIDITQKKFRLGDFLAEKVIKGVAFLSIAIIVLIFVFVFRESLPIFKSEKATVSHVAATQEVQETYGEVTDKTPPTSAVQETYGEVKDTAVVQEQYGAVKDLTEVQEQYGVQTKDTLSSNHADETYTVSSGSGYDHNRAALRTLGTTEWVPVSEKPRYGLLALFLGTLKITLISMLFAAPLAILAALYT